MSAMECAQCGAPDEGHLVCRYCGTRSARAPTQHGASSVGSVPPGVAEAIERGNLIDAIRIHRAATGLGLREAKEAVEELAAVLRRR